MLQREIAPAQVGRSIPRPPTRALQAEQLDADYRTAALATAINRVAEAARLRPIYR